MTRVGVVTEIKPGERRCAPAGHEVVVQAGAGDGSGFTDADYRRAGADLAGDAAAVWDAADLLLKANMPAAVPRTSTRALTNATFPYVRRLADLGVDALGAQDAGFSLGVSVRAGRIVSAPVADAFAQPAGGQGAS